MTLIPVREDHKEARLELLNGLRGAGRVLMRCPDCHGVHEEVAEKVKDAVQFHDWLQCPDCLHLPSIWEWTIEKKMPSLESFT